MLVESNQSLYGGSQFGDGYHIPDSHHQDKSNDDNLNLYNLPPP